jgi:HTTM domain
VQIARILIGIAALVRGLEAGRVLWHVLDPQVLRFPILSWLPRLPQLLLPGLILAWLVLAAAFTLGYRARVTGSALALLMGYTLLLDQQSYSNHLYLLVILVGVVALAENPSPFLRCQLSVVYGFSALWKCNAYYLPGTVIAAHLVPSLTRWRTFEYMAPLAAASLFVEVFLAIAFWVPRWRPAAWIVGLTLHIGCIFILAPGYHIQIAVFALEMIALYTAFGPPPFLRPRVIVTTPLPIGSSERPTFPASGETAQA